MSNMTIEAVEHKPDGSEKREVIQIPLTARFPRFSVCEESSPARHEQTSLEVQLVDPNVVGVYSRINKEGGIIFYEQEDINRASLKIEIPIAVLGVRVPFFRREAVLEWRKTQGGDYRPFSYLRSEEDDHV